MEYMLKALSLIVVLSVIVSSSIGVSSWNTLFERTTYSRDIVVKDYIQVDNADYVFETGLVYNDSAFSGGEGPQYNSYHQPVYSILYSPDYSFSTQLNMYDNSGGQGPKYRLFNPIVYNTLYGPDYTFYKQLIKYNNTGGEGPKHQLFSATAYGILLDPDYYFIKQLNRYDNTGGIGTNYSRFIATRLGVLFQPDYYMLRQLIPFDNSYGFGRKYDPDRGLIYDILYGPDYIAQWMLAEWNGNGTGLEYYIYNPVVNSILYGNDYYVYWLLPSYGKTVRFNVSLTLSVNDTEACVCDPIRVSVRGVVKGLGLPASGAYVKIYIILDNWSTMVYNVLLNDTGEASIVFRPMFSGVYRVYAVLIESTVYSSTVSNEEYINVEPAKVEIHYTLYGIPAVYSNITLNIVLKTVSGYTLPPTENVTMYISYDNDTWSLHGVYSSGENATIFIEHNIENKLYIRIVYHDPYSDLGMRRFYDTEKNIIIAIIPRPIIYHVEILNPGLGQMNVLSINLTDYFGEVPINAMVNVKVNGKSYSLPMVNGLCNYTIYFNKPGMYVIEISYNGFIGDEKVFDAINLKIYVVVTVDGILYYWGDLEGISS